MWGSRGDQAALGDTQESNNSNQSKPKQTELTYVADSLKCIEQSVCKVQKRDRKQMLQFPLAHRLSGVEEQLMSTLGQVILFYNEMQQMGQLNPIETATVAVLEAGSQRVGRSTLLQTHFYFLQLPGASDVYWLVQSLLLGLQMAVSCVSLFLMQCCFLLITTLFTVEQNHLS